MAKIICSILGNDGLVKIKPNAKEVQHLAITKIAKKLKFCQRVDISPNMVPLGTESILTNWPMTNRPIILSSLKITVNSNTFST